MINERCVFLIGEKNLVVKGYAGKIPIDKDKVEVHYILGEQKSQTLKDFINRIKDSKSRQGGPIKGVRLKTTSRYTAYPKKGTSS